MGLKEQIHIIPVTDALREPGACPFCVMRKKLDADAVAFMLSPSYMEDDIRKATNNTGFCAAHTRRLYDGGNRLGLALMLHTRLLKLISDVDCGRREKMPGGCVICGNVNETMRRYTETFFYLWESGGEERQLIEKLDGFCVEHYAMLTAAAQTCLGKQKKAEFEKTAREIQKAAMERIADDLDWFIKKFDYRYADEPWKNAKDALPRVIGMLAHD